VLTTIDHIAITVDDPKEAVEWYKSNFDTELIYLDDTWAFIQFENIKMAFVKKGTHPSHFAIEVDIFEPTDRIKKHRDDSISTYKKDPWGNIYELIKYPKNTD
jgi:catechol 2,3-dioxygenase-like lactoylglutathione lyase family enzyme